MLQQGRTVRSFSPEEKGAAETTWDGLTATPIPCPPALLGGRGSRAGPGKKGGVEQMFILDLVVFITVLL